MLARDKVLVVSLLGLSACTVSRDGLGQRYASEDPVQADEPSDDDEDEPSDEAPAEPDAPTPSSPTPSSPAMPAPSKPSEPAADGGAPSTADAGCSLTGVHALRVEADVSWTPDFRWNAYTGWTPAVASGEGTVSLLALAEVQDGVATLRACGASLPAVRGVTGTTVSGTIADASWDAVSTRWTAKISSPCEQPGCAVSSSFVQPQLGVSLPANAEWPAYDAPIAAPKLRDDDGDGHPGIRFTLDEPLRLLAPTGYNWANAVYVTDLHLALRMSTQLTGKLDSCDEASGSASKTALDSRVLGCTLDSGSACLDEQTALLQRSLPSWTVDATRWQLQRLPSGSDCKDVRDALP